MCLLLEMGVGVEGAEDDVEKKYTGEPLQDHVVKEIHYRIVDNNRKLASTTNYTWNKTFSEVSVSQSINGFKQSDSQVFMKFSNGKYLLVSDSDIDGKTKYKKKYEYDNNGILLKEIEYVAWKKEEGGKTTTIGYEYDKEGRIKNKKERSGNEFDDKDYVFSYSMKAKWEITTVDVKFLSKERLNISEKSVYKKRFKSKKLIEIVEMDFVDDKKWQELRIQYAHFKNGMKKKKIISFTQFGTVSEARGWLNGNYYQHKTDEQFDYDVKGRLIKMKTIIKAVRKDTDKEQQADESETLTTYHYK